VGDALRQEDEVAGTGGEVLITYLDLQFPVQHVEAFVLTHVDMGRYVGGENVLDNHEGTVRVGARRLQAPPLSPHSGVPTGTSRDEERAGTIHAAPPSALSNRDSVVIA
jgi:hypothetical protein